MGSMGESNTPKAKAILRFCVPDNSVGPEERSLFAFPANKSIDEQTHYLNDARTSTAITKGPGGLDVQGFTYITHRSALSDAHQSWYESKNVEEIYVPEVEKLVCNVTGAKRAVVSNIAFCRKLAKEQEDHTFVLKRGCELDQQREKLPKDVALDVDSSLEPARLAHIDYSTQGLRDSARYCRHDISAAGREALDAEDVGKAEVPRYAAYSVWRPVKTVKRDPLAVCDWRTVKKADLDNIQYRATSDQTGNGEYIMDAYAVLPPKESEGQKWYWYPEQKEDEVLIIKFADTASEKDESIAGGCPHLSPIVLGTEEEEARCSIECRVLAFW